MKEIIKNVIIKDLLENQNSSYKAGGIDTKTLIENLDGIINIINDEKLFKQIIPNTLHTWLIKKRLGLLDNNVIQEYKDIYLETTTNSYYTFHYKNVPIDEISEKLKRIFIEKIRTLNTNYIKIKEDEEYNKHKTYLLKHIDKNTNINILNLSKKMIVALNKNNVFTIGELFIYDDFGGFKSFSDVHSKAIKNTVKELYDAYVNTTNNEEDAIKINFNTKSNDKNTLLIIKKLIEENNKLKAENEKLKYELNNIKTK